MKLSELKQTYHIGMAMVAMCADKPVVAYEDEDGVLHVLGKHDEVLSRLREVRQEIVRRIGEKAFEKWLLSLMEDAQ